MNIADPMLEQKTMPIWRQAFRPMFLFSSIFGSLAIFCWALFLSGNLIFSPYGGMIFWHSHEMLFGFVSAILAGFLLTAVQNWTGIRATHGKPLVALFSLWLLARILLLTNWLESLWIPIILDLSFIPITTFLLAQLVLQGKQYKNLIFIPILLLFTSANLITHLSVVFNRPDYLAWGNYAGVFIIAFVMSLIAGRIFPMFTANGTHTSKVPPLPWLEKLVLLSTLFIAIIHLTNLQGILPDIILAGLFTCCAFAHGVRALRWNPFITLSNPLVWSLHLAYWFIPISLALFALHYSGLSVSLSSALHGLTAGAISSLILAMLARISLGHTGRRLAPHKLMSVAFASILLAGALRVLAEYIPWFLTLDVYIVAATLWVTAYGLFVCIYWKILMSPRPDGRAG